MSIYGSKTKTIPILSYELRGSISDEMGGDKIQWHNTHVLSTLVGTFSISLLYRRGGLRGWLRYNRFGRSIFIGPLNIDYEAPDFETYMTDDAEMLDRRLKG